MPSRFVPNIGNILTRTAQFHGAAVGLVHGAETVTWAELERGANALAAALLDLGVQKGDRVAIQSHNSRAMFEGMFAIARTGAVYVPINPRASEIEAIQMVGLCDARVLVASAEFANVATHAAAAHAGLEHVIVVGGARTAAAGASRWHSHAGLLERFAAAATIATAADHDDICWHHFTSGTTGVPKGGLNSHGGVMFALMNRLIDVTPGFGPEDCLLTVAPISHGTGTMTTVNALVGARIVIPSGKSFDPAECWTLIERHRVSAMFTVPTILMRLLRDERARRADRSSLKHVVVAGAAMTPADMDFAIEMLGDALVQYYGAVESVGAGTVIRPNSRQARAAGAQRSIGQPRIGTEIMIAGEGLRALEPGAVGELCLRGPGVFPGYYKNPEATAAVLTDGWYRTGDLAYMDERGYVYLTGRLKEMFKSGGLQVYPNEIQDLLAAHPAVAEAHLVSLPDSDLGEVGVAAVALKPGASASEAELAAFIGDRLARYKRPRRIFIVDEVPRGITAKVPKELVRKLLIERGLVVEGRDVAPLSV